MSDSCPSAITQVTITGQSLTLAEVVAVARYRVPVSLDPAARRRVAKCRAVVDHLLDRGVKVYGLTTGFGSKRNVLIDPKDTVQLQQNLIASHAAGVGAPLPEDVVRATILLRANTLARGNSGIRDSVLDRLLEMLNKGIYPYVPSQGSLGASGDLAPLSHLALVLTGQDKGLIHDPSVRPAPSLQKRRGEDYVAEPRREHFVPATQALLQSAYGYAPITLQAKEGLALNNGTQVMSAIGALTVYDARRLILQAEIACAGSIEAMQGVTRAFEDRIHQARPHPGQRQSAHNLRRLLKDSAILELTLNTALVRRARQRVMDALETLSLTQLPLLREVEEVLKKALGELEAILSDPMGHQKRGMGEVSADESEHLTSTLLELQGARNCLRPVLSHLHLAGHALTSPSIPSVLQPAAEATTDAITHLEAAAPRQPRVQDDYCLRCAPQVLGAARDTLTYVTAVLETEINSATDNPLIFPPPEVEAYEGDLEGLKPLLTDRNCVDAVCSGGNFHGEPVALAMDALKVALAEVGNISERRVAKLVDGNLNQGLPSLLVNNPGLNSGLMIPQYTAASLVSENKVLAHPASVDSIPSCENTEDHVSMGTIAARQAREILLNVEQVVAIEVFNAFQGLSFRLPVGPGVAFARVQEALTRAGVTLVEQDRVLFEDMEKICALIRQEVLLEAVERGLQSTLE